MKRISHTYLTRKVKHLNWCREQARKMAAELMEAKANNLILEARIQLLRQEITMLKMMQGVA